MFLYMHSQIRELIKLDILAKPTIPIIDIQIIITQRGIKILTKEIG
jgi:hypothetical protein